MSNCPNCGAPMIPGCLPGSAGWCKEECDLNSNTTTAQEDKFYVLVALKNIDENGCFLKNNEFPVFDAYTTQAEAFVILSHMRGNYAVFTIPKTDLSIYSKLSSSWFVVDIPIGYSIASKRVDG